MSALFTVHDPIGTAVDAIHATGGVTIDVTTSEQPTSGFAVSIPGCEEIHDWATCYVADALTRYVNEHAEELSRPGAHLGAWIDTESDPSRLYLDVSVVLADRADALAYAGTSGQLAIFDLSTFEEIRVITPYGGIFDDTYDRSIPAA